nr:ATP-binding protein [Olsenella profusa]
MVIREIVENFIHAYFQAPTITILDGGNTIRFSDQGPGIASKDLALEYGTSSATEEMKHYIRGVGSGLPYVQQYMTDKGGSLEIEDNIAGGTVVTISTHPREEARAVSGVSTAPSSPMSAPTSPQTQSPWQPPASQAPVPQQMQGWAQQAYPGPWSQPYQQGAWQPAAQAWVPRGPSAYPYQPAPGAPSSFSPEPQPQPQAAYQVPSPQRQVAPFVPAIQLDDRSHQVLTFLAEHEVVGPTELVRAFGSSAATWSRTLSNLNAQGLVTKVGQKYQLTAVGRTFV